MSHGEAVTNKNHIHFCGMQWNGKYTHQRDELTKLDRNLFFVHDYKYLCG
jgi:hypothetical protein